MLTEGVKPDPEKVSAIRDMEPPTDKKGLARYLGMINYLSKFIPLVSHKTKRLRTCLNKDKFEWSTEQESEFNYMKEIF